jgi:sugar lactone lactonase YvrE
MNFSIARIVGNAFALALAVGIAGLAACGGGGGGGIVTTLMGGAIQGAPLSLASASSSVTMVSTLAGSGTYGSTDGASGVAQFNWISGQTTDGTNLYVVENCGNTNDIRKIEIATGMVSTLAGSSATGAADGTGTAASFYCPWGITTDGNALYVVDSGNSEIRKIAPSSGSLSAMTSANAVVTTLAGSSTNTGAADGTGTAATFNWPSGITTDGTSLYMTDPSNQKIRKITPSSGSLSAMTSANAVVTSLTGASGVPVTAGAADGAGATASFNYPNGITTDGTSLYVADTNNNKIRKIVIATGEVSSLTGAANVAVISGAADGAGATASFSYPDDITTDGSHLYVLDTSNNKIRMIAPSSGSLSAMTNANAAVSSITGASGVPATSGATDGAAGTATFSTGLYGITTDGSSLYVTDEGNNLIRKIH